VEVTLECCNAFCGADPTWYPDTVVRLNAWIFPALVLASNMHVSALDSRRYFAMLHLFGDPLDTLWSLLETLSIWTRLARLDASLRQRPLSDNPGGLNFPEYLPKVLGTVFGGIEEIMPSTTGSRLVELDDVEAAFYRLLDMPASNTFPAGAVRHAIEMTAHELADNRTDDILRTALAVVLYFWLVISNFFDILGGDKAPPAGRSATALATSWIISTVMLSNLMGGFVSHRSCFAALRKLASNLHYIRARPPELILEGVEGVAPRMDEKVYSAMGYKSDHEFWDNQHGSGALYTYRPHKRFFRWRSARVLGLAFLPLVIATACSVALVWYNIPNGLDCRGVMLLLFFVTYLLSGVTTWTTAFLLRRRIRYHFHITMAKDSVVCLSTLLLIFLSSAGLFNTCSCATGLFLPHSSALIPLLNEPRQEENRTSRYMVIYLVCLGLQLLFFAVVWGIERKGVGLMRWSEAEKQRIFAGKGRDGELCSIARGQLESEAETAPPRPVAESAPEIQIQSPETTQLHRLSWP
jgi:hypothetical protein